MALVGFTRLDLYGQGAPRSLDEEVHLALLLAVEVVKAEAMSVQLLHHKVLVDGAKINIRVIIQNARLYALSVKNR